MATFSSRKLTRTIVQYTVPAAQPWGASEQDIFMAFQAAKNQHATVNQDRVTPIKFLPGDEDILIEFSYEDVAPS